MVSAGENLKESMSSTLSVLRTMEEKLKCATDHASSGANKRTERKEVAGFSVKRLKLTSQVPIGIYIDECIFCHSFRRKMKGLGKLLHIQDGKVVSEPDISSKARVVYAHEFCLHWSPGIYYEGDQIMNLQNEIRRSAKLTCAYQILECRWDTENFRMLCPNHVSKKLQCDNGPAHSDKATNKNNLRPQSTQKVKHVYCRRNKQNKLTQTEACEQSKGKMLVLLAVQLSEADMVMLAHFSERFGAILTDKWRNDVTHVVTSSDTIQKCIQLRHAYEVMMAILQGTWIINIGWIKACLEKEGVPEEHYEVHKDCYGYLEGPRRGRLRAVANKAPNLFTRYGFMLSKDFPQDTKC